TIAVWTGHQVIVWGGVDWGQTRSFHDGAAYDPAASSWRRLPRAPIRPDHSIGTWTGHELLVLGSDGKGAAYDPKQRTWRRIAPFDLDLEQGRPMAIWNGSEAIVLPAGAAYDPATDQ